ncbi:probable purine permease 10 [Cajanus cajan]|uniref:Probable purine permease n=1 Tax=Cajanus cajan TaxID=3821 RepID=A0A151R338_CAJCA|nr:probable purine permease 10 [Cajanus cajan]KYP37008.1 putative purine permease 10 [Cajanus cajan]
MSTSIVLTEQPQHSRLREYKRWFRVTIYIMLLLVAQCTATILGRLYFEKGGKSKWVAALVQSAGFPILVPLLFYSQKYAKPSHSSEPKPKIPILLFIYLVFGLITSAMDLLYAYGLSYLPLSTFALVCASQLGFNAVFTFFLNSQKFTPLIFNSVVLLTLSVTLLASSAESEDTKDLPKEKRIIGFFCALAGSAAFSLQHCLEQLFYEKVMKTEILPAVLSINLYPLIISSGCTLVGLFVSGDWKTVKMEMMEFGNGRVSYVMTLVWTAVTWQIACIGMSGLIFEVSSLFSVVIGNLELTIAPILAVIVFHDKINGVKVIAFLLAIWGVLSYMYQHYLDDRKVKEDKGEGSEV